MRVSTLLMALVAIGGCDEPDPTLRPRPSPDPQTASRLFREAIESDAGVREKLCGAPVSGPANIELNLADIVLPGTVNAEITLFPGTPKRCEGVIVGLFDAVDRAADPLVFKLQKLEVVEVRTPGHEWKKSGR